jgi:hypothetical protein
VALEVGLAAEQPEAVLHLPLDARLVGRRLRLRRCIRNERKQERNETQNSKSHDRWTHDGARIRRKLQGATDSTDRAAEM